MAKRNAETTKKVSFANTRTLLSIEMYFIFLLKSILLCFIMLVCRVNENDAVSQCKYDQNLTLVGLDH